jgi:hypothetical protein
MISVDLYQVEGTAFSKEEAESDGLFECAFKLQIPLLDPDTGMPGIYKLQSLCVENGSGVRVIREGSLFDKYTIKLAEADPNLILRRLYEENPRLRKGL